MRTWLRSRVLRRLGNWMRRYGDQETGDRDTVPCCEVAMCLICWMLAAPPLAPEDELSEFDGF